MEAFVLPLCPTLNLLPPPLLISSHIPIAPSLVGIQTPAVAEGGLSSRLSAGWAFLSIWPIFHFPLILHLTRLNFASIATLHRPVITATVTITFSKEIDLQEAQLGNNGEQKRAAQRNRKVASSLGLFHPTWRGAGWKPTSHRRWSWRHEGSWW